MAGTSSVTRPALLLKRRELRAEEERHGRAAWWVSGRLVLPGTGPKGRESSLAGGVTNTMGKYVPSKSPNLDHEAVQEVFAEYGVARRSLCTAS